MTLGKIGSRSMFGWRNPYVTEGLAAMWDGEWNSGGGVHDSNTTTWKDLTDNGHDITVSQGVFGNNFYDLSRQSLFTFNYKLKYATVEFVGRIDVMANDRAGIYLNLPDTGIAFGRYNTKGIFSHRLAGYGNKQFILPTPYPRSMSVTFSPGDKSAFFDGIVPTSTNEIWTALADNTFVGNIYDMGIVNSVRIYSRALTAEEIASNYAVDKARFNLT